MQGRAVRQCDFPEEMEVPGQEERGMSIVRADIPIFNRSVVVCFGCSAEEASHLCYMCKGAGGEPVGAKVEFTSIANGGVRDWGGDVYVWIKDPVYASIVFHELVHVAFTVCQICGMREDEELIAYLVQWLKVNVADKIFEAVSTTDSVAEEGA